MGYKVLVNGRPLESLSATETAAYHRLGKARFEAMLASGKPPRAVTDDTFRANQGNANGGQFADDPHVGDFYKSVAAKAGVSTTGKTYLGGLAEYPGDPEAWVDSRGDVKRVCEKRGWGCEGAVTTKLDQVEPVFTPATPATAE